MYAVLAMFLCWAVPTSPPEPPPSGIALIDAQKFGVDRLVVWQMTFLARGHSEVMRETVKANNSLDVADRWEAECKYRARCWDLLTIALDDDAAKSAAFLAYPENRPPTDFEIYRAKLNALAELRAKIGNEDYYAGVMPPPTPRYRLHVGD